MCIHTLPIQIIWNTLQRTVTHRLFHFQRVLQHSATHDNTLQYPHVKRGLCHFRCALQHTTTHCNTLMSDEACVISNARCNTTNPDLLFRFFRTT